MYMTSTVGIAELRQNLSKHLQRIRDGERLIVTDRNRPVATLGPPPGQDSPRARLIADGSLVAATNPDPIRIDRVRLDDPRAGSDALTTLREEER